MKGQGRIFKRGKRFWIAFYVRENGRSKEIREPGGSTEAEARRALKQRLRERSASELGLKPFQGPKQERITVEELLQNLERDYQIRGRKGLPQLRSHLKHIRAFFGLDRAVTVTAERLRQYIEERLRDGAAPATINRGLEGLQRAFALALDSGALAAAPRFPSLPEHNARQGFFERGDFYTVLANIPETDVRDFLEWFYYTGMRPGEIRSLTWNCFDRETWTLRLHAKDAKIGAGRVIALEGPLRDIIERRIRARRFGCDFIFHRNGERLGEFRKSWTTACKLAGVADRIPYDLRRTAVRNMIRAGVPERVAMAISGHKTRAVFDRYNIVSERDLREAIQKTVAYLEALPTEPKAVRIQKASEMVQ